MGLVADAYGSQTAVGLLGALLLAFIAIVVVTQKRLRAMQ